MTVPYVKHTHTHMCFLKPGHLQQILTQEETDISIMVKGVKLLKITISVNITNSFLQF